MSQPRTVLITGGSKGIGNACANIFVKAGHKVSVTYRNNDVPSELVDKGVLALKCDVSEPTQISDVFSHVEENFGPVEILVANAGMTKDTLMLRMSENAWDEVIQTNLTSAYHLTKHALAKMVKGHWGRIIYISSVVAQMGVAGQANYGASKAGLIGLARSLAREVASRSITVNVIAPGAVDTDMLNILGEEKVKLMLDLIPMQRAASPDEIAAAVAFLASEQARYITGVVLPVDGGLAMGF
ncbi:MAG: 3-oxoacyl-ACP reductase FabG [Actinomycetota bacterium]|jgi:3-oxoacyl-[acyl-carrier protein] reductase|nr:3-oxoacyl-ACP reductase FabG [Actinomycetota bacterium]